MNNKHTKSHSKKKMKTKKRKKKKKKIIACIVTYAIGLMILLKPFSPGKKNLS